MGWLDRYGTCIDFKKIFYNLWLIFFMCCRSVKYLYLLTATHHSRRTGWKFLIQLWNIWSSRYLHYLWSWCNIGKEKTNFIQVNYHLYLVWSKKKGFFIHWYFFSDLLIGLELKRLKQSSPYLLPSFAHMPPVTRNIIWLPGTVNWYRA